MAIRLTLAVPTHNRAATLGETLASLAAQSLPEDIETECIVIDNNSTDRTPAVVEEAAARAPFAMRRVFEARPGSSFARNRAVDEAVGDFILFIDDDAVAESNWAALMLAQIERRGLDATGFRRECFARFGRFREDLGVVGGNPISGEDTELFARIIAGGGAMGFVAEARGFHLVPAARMNRKYLLRKAFAFGVGTAQAGGRSHNHLDKLVRNAIRMAGAAARGDRERALCHELECANFFGYWWGRLPRRGAPRASR